MKRLILLAAALALSGCAAQFGTKLPPAPHAAPHVQQAPAAAPAVIPTPTPAPAALPAAVPQPPAKKARLFDRIKSHLHRKKEAAK